MYLKDISLECAVCHSCCESLNLAELVHAVTSSPEYGLGHEHAK